LWNKIQSIQIQALRLALGYRKSTPLNIILTESCEPIFKDRIEFLGHNYIARTSSQPNHPLNTIFSKIDDHLNNPTLVKRISAPLLYECHSSFSRIAHLFHQSNIPTFCLYDYSLKFFCPQVSFEEGILLKEDPQPSSLFNSLFPLLSNQNHYFTDGSKIENLPFSGFAVYDRNNNLSLKKRTSDRASIFTCEAMAILTALQRCESDIANLIFIFSDSKSVLEAISSNKNFKKRNHLIWEIIQSIYKLYSINKEIKLFWIPAHVGIECNELVDKLAKEAAISGVDVQLPLPISDAKTL